MSAPPRTPLCSPKPRSAGTLSCEPARPPPCCPAHSEALLWVLLDRSGRAPASAAELAVPSAFPRERRGQQSGSRQTCLSPPFPPWERWAGAWTVHTRPVHEVSIRGRGRVDRWPPQALPTCGGVSRGPGGGRGGPHAPDPHHDPSGRMLSCHLCGPSGRPGGGLAERPRRQDCTARARTSGRSRQGRRGRQRSLRLRPLHLAHFQVPGGRQAFCGPLRRPDRRCPVRDAAGPGGQPGAGRGQRDWPWPAWSPAGPGAACSRSGRRLRAGTGARSLSWGSRGAGWGGRTPEPRSPQAWRGGSASRPLLAMPLVLLRAGIVAKDVQLWAP